MKDKTPKYLEDIKSASGLVSEFTKGKKYNDYTNDALLRSGVERQLEIIGEALSQLSKADPDTGNSIKHHRRIIGFRNILAHGYAIVDNHVVWDIVEQYLPELAKQVEDLLE